MSELTEWTEKFGWPAIDILVLVGLAGGLVFAVWCVGGAIVDVCKALLVRPERKLGKHAAPVGTVGPVFLLALSGGAAASAVVWWLT